MARREISKKGIRIRIPFLVCLLYISMCINITVSFTSSRLKNERVDFRSGWALSWGRPMSRFTRDARSRVSGQQDVGHEGVITGRDALSLRSPIANPLGVAQSPLQSTNSLSVYLLVWTIECFKHNS